MSDDLQRLIATFSATGRWADLARLTAQAAQLQPNSALIHLNHGLALLNLRQTEQAIASLQRAITLLPDFPEALCILGVAYLENRRFDLAREVLLQALRLQPNFAIALHNLGLVYTRLHQIDEACAVCEQAARLAPNVAEIQGGLANVYKVLGRLEEAVAVYRRSLALDPRQAATHSNLLFALHLLAGVSAEEIFREHRVWGEKHAVAPVFIRPHLNDRDPERRLRLGYASADFRDHVVGRYTEMIVQTHDRQAFEVCCYSNGPIDDATRLIQRFADHWRDIRGVSDETADEMIREDRIDVLVDLSGHTGGNRLPLFARKPAPIQATHRGYPYTSGNSAIDYRISDAVLDPPGESERFSSEYIVRMPEIEIFYNLKNIDVPVNDLPALSSAAVTFGSLNNFCKVTAPAIALWARILQRMPASRLLILSGVSPHADQQLCETFAEHGVPAERLILVGNQSRSDYFRLYHRVDLALDTFPYAGGNTTCDALWMGVPVVTLMGATGLSRQGADPLAHLGLHDLIAESVHQYEQTAVRLAENLPRLAELRATLRQRMKCSTMMNPQRFTRQLEDVYRWMWRQWCFRVEPRP